MEDADVAKAKGLAGERFKADPKLRRVDVEVGGLCYTVGIGKSGNPVLLGVRPATYPELHPNQVGAGH